MLSRVTVVLAVLALLGCGDDPSGDPADASTADAAPACLLPTAPVECTDNPECEALCAGAYCREFGQLGQLVCTNDCTSGDQCPDGWSCNMMGRCRPPG